MRFQKLSGFFMFMPKELLRTITRKRRWLIASLLAVMGFVFSVSAQATTYTWSDYKTHLGGLSPGADVTIEAGDIVYYDNAVGDSVGNLIIVGKFYCADPADYSDTGVVRKLDVESIMVMGAGALFECGESITNRFAGKFELVFHESDGDSASCASDPDGDDYRTHTNDPKYRRTDCQGFEVMSGGEVSIFGSMGKYGWTKISSDAAKDADEINVLDATNWQAGDEIVIAASANDINFSVNYPWVNFDWGFFPKGSANPDLIQRLIVGARSSNTLTFADNKLLEHSVVGQITSYGSEAPQYDYALEPDGENTIADIFEEKLGAMEDQAGNSLAERITDKQGAYLQLDERTEVANLTRNIRFIGTPAGSDLDRGMHIMVMDGAGSVQIDGLEIKHGGRAGELARYPFHWHKAKDRSGDFIRNSSIHDSFNRCITVHGTNNTVVEKNVCVNINGSAYFLEDGNEVGNAFIDNIAILVNQVHPSKALLQKGDSNSHSDLFIAPAAFWISHPDNIFIGNSASSAGTGFWYVLKDDAHKDGSMVATEWSADAAPNAWPYTLPSLDSVFTINSVTVNLADQTFHNMNELIAAINAELSGSGVHAVAIHMPSYQSEVLKFRAENHTASINVDTSSSNTMIQQIIGTSGAVTTGVCDAVLLDAQDGLDKCTAPLQSHQSIFSGNSAHTVALGASFDGSPSGGCMENPLKPCVTDLERDGDQDFRQGNQNGVFMKTRLHTLYADDFTAYKVQKFALWNAGSNAPALTHMIVADNKENLGSRNEQNILNSLVIGASPYQTFREYKDLLYSPGALDSAFGFAGVMTLYDGPLGFSNILFAGYDSEAYPGQVPIKNTGGARIYQNRFENIRVENSATEFADLRAVDGGVIYDTDGSLTGAANSSVIDSYDVASWYLSSETGKTCTQSSNFKNAYICPGEFGSMYPMMGYVGGGSNGRGMEVNRIDVNASILDAEPQENDNYGFLRKHFNFSIDRADDFKYEVEAHSLPSDKFSDAVNFSSAVYQIGLNDFSPEIIIKVPVVGGVPTQTCSVLPGQDDQHVLISSSPLSYKIKATLKMRTGHPYEPVLPSSTKDSYWGVIQIHCEKNSGYTPVDADSDDIDDAIDDFIDSNNDDWEDAWLNFYCLEHYPASTCPTLLPEGDDDSDGVSNLDESIRGLDPFAEDTDGDGWPDEYEINLPDRDPLAVDFVDDIDGDGISDTDETTLGTDAYNYFDPPRIKMGDGVLCEFEQPDLQLTFPQTDPQPIKQRCWSSDGAAVDLSPYGAHGAEANMVIVPIAADLGNNDNNVPVVIGTGYLWLPAWSWGVEDPATASPYAHALSLGPMNDWRKLELITQTVTAPGHVCQLGIRGSDGYPDVQCWGAIDGILDVPEFLDPKVIALGENDACVIDGSSLNCWGSSAVTSGYPSGTGFTQVAVGSGHACAIRSGSIECWGDSADGKTVPQLVSGDVPEALAAGDNHTCALVRNSAVTAVRCWGVIENADVPTALQGVDARLVSVAATGDQTCAVKVPLTSPRTAFNSITCWPNALNSDGDNLNDVQELGLSTNPLNALDPPLVSVTDEKVLGLDDPNFMTSTFGSLTVWHSSTGLFDAFSDNLASKSTIAMTNPATGGGFWLDKEGVWYVGYGYGLAAPMENGIKLSGYAAHICAASSSSGVQCYGAGETDTGIDDEFGQSIVPSFLTDVSGVSDVTAGLHHSCAIDGAGVHCWGDDTFGQKTVPSLITPTAVAAGDKHTCAIVDGGSVQCWGANDKDQLGADANVDGRVDGVSSALTITAGSNHTCVLNGSYDTPASLSVICWGANDHYQSQVPTGLVNPVSVSAGGNHTCAVQAGFDTSAAATVCWPVNIDGDNDGIVDTDGDGLSDGWELQYGLNPLSQDTDNDSVTDDAENADSDALSNLEEFTFGSNPLLTDTDGDSLGDGAELVWGSNPNNPDTDDDGHGDHEEVVLGSNPSNRLDPPLPILTAGNAYGVMLMGAVGDLDFATSTAAHDIFWNAQNGSAVANGPITKQIADIVITDADLCELHSDSTAGCWASSLAGTAVTKLSANHTHVCMIEGGAVQCSGDDTYGQSTPPSLSGVTDIAAGLQHSCAIDATDAYCWGSNSDGQSTVPTLVAAPVAIAAGDKHTCAVVSGGNVQCWGDDTNNQLGADTNVDGLVDGITDARMITAGANHTCVIMGNYLSVGGPRVACWGAMDRYQSQVPASLTNGTDIPVNIRAAGDQTCAIKAEATPSAVSTPIEELMTCWPVNIDADSDGVVDTDADGLPDGWEAQYGFNPLVDNSADLSTDADSDGLTNLQESQGCTANSPAWINGSNPFSGDTDGDGVVDQSECLWDTNPNEADTDGDGLTDYEEAYTPFGSRYQPQSADTDCIAPPYGSYTCDAVNDGDEDCDGDSYSNLYELQNSTDPTNGAACIN